jgi:hypothetical protein
MLTLVNVKSLQSSFWGRTCKKEVLSQVSTPSPRTWNSSNDRPTPESSKNVSFVVV